MFTSLSRGAAALTLLAACCGQAFGYGAVGHNTVGDIASQLIQGHRAAAEVKRILGDISLRDIAVWDDCVKGIDPSKDFQYTSTGRFPECAVFEKPDEEARMRQYVQRNLEQCKPKAGDESCHKQYHYSNVAIQRGRYQPGAVGTSDHDLVPALKAAILVLRGGPETPPMDLNEREALALVAHTLGDLHQPLHMGSIYLDANGKVYDPDKQGADAQTHTVGGNAITLPKPDGTPGGNLHSYWDGLPNRLSPAQLAAMPAQAKLVTPTGGSPDRWVDEWASESLLQAQLAFDGMRFGPRQQTPRGSRWAATPPADYDTRSTEQVRLELIKGGARLAQLLMSIWPDKP
ncbi:S1/P1 nuclease [Roseateles sp. SL47]|jgi:S1/P1 Nuclease|uniref:S1/P1 nuclease n=1 Tax=Roseateles sp. SL47 TaxID=2995138 RepID=UPI0022703F8B|nr:S1/P1 nuclease [Roseateles sp. SL47]WAC74085.1 S1/P1 nuclease [Roseateles sp. SL47]